MGEWRVMVAETVTGKLLADVTPRDLPSFSRAVTDKGTWTINVLPEERNNTHLDLHSFTDAGRFSWIITYDDYVVQAGPVWTYTYDENTRNLSISGSGLQGIFDRRVLRNPNGHTAIVHESEDLVLTNLSLRGIAQAIVQANLAQPGYGLPIDLPATPEAGTNTRTYEGYDLAQVWQRLKELSEVINGPEIDFAPYIVEGANLIRWSMAAGSPTLGDQTTAAVWDYGGALSQIDVDVNGSASPCTRVWVKGSGTERALLTGYAEDRSLIELGYPPTDYVDTEHSSVTVQQTLEDYADAALKEFSAPMEKWSCSVRVDGITARDKAVSPALGTWSLGDAPTFGISGHPWIADGQYRRRILGFNGRDESTVDLVLAETLEVL